MLLGDIINLLSNETASLSEALLKTKVLLHKIGKKELAQWVNKELDGYQRDSVLPAYRILPSHVKGNVANPARRYQSFPIPIGHLKPEERKHLEHAYMFESLAVLEDMSKRAKHGSVSRPIPMEYNARLGETLGNHYDVEAAWILIGVHDIKGIAAHIRSRLLDFLLDLQDSVGNASSDAELQEKATAFDATGMFNNAIFGANATIVVGHDNIQNVHNRIEKGDFAALEQRLTTLGIPADEITSLQRAMDEDRESGRKPSFEGKTGNWFTKLLGRAAQGALRVGVDGVASGVSKALSDYFGS
jgi:hypothetical protein